MPSEGVATAEGRPEAGSKPASAGLVLSELRSSCVLYSTVTLTPWGVTTSSSAVMVMGL